MEQFLRTYYKNLNPNATEEEILAFLESQGFGLGNQTVTGGITSSPNIFQDSGGDSGPATRPNIPVGAKPPNLFTRTLATIFAPPVGIAMNLQALADKGKLPGKLNEVFASRSSADVEVDLPTTPTGYGGFGSSESAAEAARDFGGRDYSQSPGAIAGDMEYGEE